MSFFDAAVILLAGIAAGIINVVAGAGTLITFPTLLALGFSPVTANVSNTVGLVPGSIAGAFGYRRDLTGQWRSVMRMASLSVIGGLVGAVLLLMLPPASFSAIVPFLLIAAAVLAAIQPRVARFVRRHAPDAADTRPLSVGLVLGVLATGIYGGYFGAAQGVMLLALLGTLWSTNLNRANGAKNVLAGVANLVSAGIFILSGTVDWLVVLLIGLGSAAGGWLGSRIGRRLPATVLRSILVVVALTGAVVLFFT